MNIIQINNLVKNYGKKIAVDGISLTVSQGSIYGILGPNGAGKSTTINMISGLLVPTSGQIKVFEKDIKNNKSFVKNNIGLVPQDIAIYEDLTALENVKFFGSLYGLSGKKLENAADEALSFVGLSDRKKDKPSKYSGGMKRRLNIACAIVHKPKLIIMDEPTVGIDPQSRNHILDSIKKLSKTSTVIYTSHYMEEIEAICSDIAIIDNGKIIEQGTLNDIKKQYSKTRIIKIETSILKNQDQVTKEILSLSGVEKVNITENFVTVYTNSGSDNMVRIISIINELNNEVKNIESKLNDLETIFLNLTGKNLRD